MIKDYNGHQPQIHSTAYVSDHALVVGKVTLNQNSSIWPGAVLRGDIEDIVIGQNSNLQDGVTAHTSEGLPVMVGKNVTVGHGAILHGCSIGDNCLIGMGAIILDGAVIEENCIVGAGALVTEGDRVVAGSLVLGTPARRVRQTTLEEIDRIKQSAEKYVACGRMHRQNSSTL